MLLSNPESPDKNSLYFRFVAAPYMFANVFIAFPKSLRVATFGSSIRVSPVIVFESMMISLSIYLADLESCIIILGTNWYTADIF